MTYCNCLEACETPSEETGCHGILLFEGSIDDLVTSVGVVCAYSCNKPSCVKAVASGVNPVTVEIGMSAAAELEGNGCTRSISFEISTLTAGTEKMSFIPVDSEAPS